VRNSDVTFVLIETDGDSDLVDGDEEDGSVGDLLSLGDLPTALSSPAADLPSSLTDTAVGTQSDAITATPSNATTAAVRDDTSSTAAVHDETAPTARDGTSTTIDAAYFDSHCADCRTQFKVIETNVISRD
jgi:hypothetical protein